MFLHFLSCVSFSFLPCLFLPFPTSDFISFLSFTPSFSVFLVTVFHFCFPFVYEDLCFYILYFPVLLFLFILSCFPSDSSVGIALGYGPDDRGSRVRFPAGAGILSLHHRVQNGSGSHPPSYPMVTRGSVPGDKAAGA
jgi:hypothetical protein